LLTLPTLVSSTSLPSAIAPSLSLSQTIPTTLIWAELEVVSMPPPHHPLFILCPALRFQT
jgi:hypothetical protein